MSSCRDTRTRSEDAAAAVCADGNLEFDGLVASPDGKEVFKTSRSGAWTEQEVLRLGREAGEELKKEAGPEFFTWLQ